MNNPQKALSWITNILWKQNIPFQVAGGLAMQAYGSSRDLYDIDIDIPEQHFETLKQEVLPFITFGPDYFKNECWDLFLMTLNYHGQEIDISGTDCIKIYNKKTGAWEKVMTNFSKINHIKLYDITLPVIGREELGAYKKLLARHVDLLDVEYLEKNG